MSGVVLRHRVAANRQTAIVVRAGIVDIRLVNVEDSVEGVERTTGAVRLGHLSAWERQNEARNAPRFITTTTRCSYSAQTKTPTFFIILTSARNKYLSSLLSKMKVCISLSMFPSMLGLIQFRAHCSNL